MHRISFIMKVLSSYLRKTQKKVCVLVSRIERKLERFRHIIEIIALLIVSDRFFKLIKLPRSQNCILLEFSFIKLCNIFILNKNNMKNYLKTIMGQYITLVFASLLDLFLDHFWTIFGPFLDHFWTTFGPSLDHFWTLLDHF